MEENYGLRQFYRRFCVFGLIFFGTYFLLIYHICDMWNRKLLLLLLVGAGFFVSTFLIARKEVKRQMQQMKAVADIMVEIVEERGEIPEEPYLEGEIGYLYTNLYKLVNSLRESKDKEKQEKIFLRDIISDIAHQLKTPLASLTVFTDLLYEDRVTEEEKRKQLLAESKNQISRMEWMVLSMLKLARIEAGAIVFEKTPSHLKQLLEQAAESVGYLTDQRKQRIKVVCESDLLLSCDGEWLTEAIINLLKNASDYSPEATTISIEVEHTAVYTRIYVKDQGMGIPQEALPHIFKRFYRVNNEVNPNSVGIGLSLTKSIVEGMGGKISVRSELGRSTTFLLTFVDMDGKG